MQQPHPYGTPSPVKNQILPNGVRFRLALSTIINDLFARHAPVQRHLHFQDGAPTLSSSSAASGSNSGAPGSRWTTQSSLSSSTPSRVSLLRLPQSLVPLLFVSGTTTTISSTLSPNHVRLFPLFTLLQTYLLSNLTSLSARATCEYPQCLSARARHIRSWCDVPDHSKPIFLAALSASPAPLL